MAWGPPQSKHATTPNATVLRLNVNAIVKKANNIYIIN